jgi:AcrR family transcriptional regulator
MTTSAQTVVRTEKYLTRQDAILRAATGILNDKGLRGMTLGQVAERFGIVSTGVAYYFRSKEALASACFLQAIEAHNRLIGEAMAGPTVADRLSRLVESYFDLMRRIAVGEADDIAHFDDLRALDDPATEAAYVDMFRHVRRLLDPNPGQRQDRVTLNARAHSLIQQLIFARTWLRRYDPADYARAGRRMLDILLHGLGSEVRPWRAARLTMPGSATAQPDDPREVFLRAATQLITEQGFRGASVERIAARLEVTKGAFYYHIDAKDDLIEICYARTAEVVRTTQQAADRVPADARDRLAAALGHLVDHQLKGDVPLLRPAVTSLPDGMRQRVTLVFERNGVRFGSMISDGIADRSLRPVDVQIATSMVNATVNASAELANWLPGAPDDRATETFLRPLFEGLAPVEPRRTSG